MLQVLSPGVQHAEKADFCSEVLWISRDLDECFGAGSEQQAVQSLLVLQSQRRQLMGKREDEVEVRHRKQVFGPLREPLFAGVGLALWTMPVSARVIGDGLMAASGTPVEVPSESCRAAVADGFKHFQLWPAEMVPVSFDEAVARRADDVGHLEGGPVHFFLRSGERRIVSGLLTCRSSSGLATACRCFCDRCKVNDGVLDFGMPKQILNRPQVCAGFEQVRGVTVPQRVRTDSLRDACAFASVFAGMPDRLRRSSERRHASPGRSLGTAMSSASSSASTREEFRAVLR